MFNEPSGEVTGALLPERLKAARQARGWTVEEVGAQLKLPARVVVRVEDGRYEDLGAPIYRRGYLRSFARLVGVPDSEVEAELQRMGGEAPALVATGVMPRGQYVTERYLRPATYIALTALIALPVVWWAASGRLAQDFSAGHSLELQTRLTGASGRADGPAESGGSEVMRASLMPLPTDGVRDLPLPEPRPILSEPAAPAEDAADGDAAAGAAVEGESIGSGEFEAVLTLDSASWVEVLDGNGRRLHQALLQPGRWSYRSDGPLSFTIGNSRNAQLLAAGKAVDLAAYRSSNDVARVQVFGSEG